MDELQSMWPKLTTAQREVITATARAFLFAEPQSQSKYMTARQIHEEFGKSTSTVYKAVREHRLKSALPEGSERGMLFKRSAVMQWLGL